MADAFPSFLATCKTNGAYIGATGYVVDLSIDSSPDKLILGGSEPRYGNTTLEIDTKGGDPTNDGASYTKEQLANYSFVLKSCSYAIDDPEAKSTVRDLAVRVAKMSDAVPAPAPKPAKKPAPQKAIPAQTLRATVETSSAPHLQNHSLEGILR